MTYAIIYISGKQLIIKPNEWFDIDYLKNGNIGDYIKFNKILFFNKNNKIQIGQPILNKCEIFARIVQSIKGKKLKILKTKEKKNYTRTKGHRQLFTRILF